MASVDKVATSLLQKINVKGVRVVIIRGDPLTYLLNCGAQVVIRCTSLPFISSALNQLSSMNYNVNKIAIFFNKVNQRSIDFIHLLSQGIFKLKGKNVPIICQEILVFVHHVNIMTYLPFQHVYFFNVIEENEFGIPTLYEKRLNPNYYRFIQFEYAKFYQKHNFHVEDHIYFTEKFLCDK